MVAELIDTTEEEDTAIAQRPARVQHLNQEVERRRNRPQIALGDVRCVACYFCDVTSRYVTEWSDGLIIPI